MIPSEVIEGTKRRYRERGGIREEKAPRVAVGAVMAINDADRIGKRLARVASVEAAATPVSTGGLVEPVVQPTAARRRGPVEMALERVIGQSDLVGIGYLAIALRVSRSVGCIELRSRTGSVLGHGTGFMVSPRLLLTNNHVLQDPDQAVHSQVAFNFERGPEGQLLTSVAFELDPGTFFVTHPALDYSLVAVRPTARDGTALAGFGWLPLIEEQGKVLEGEYVNIIQHPNGEPKQLALRENQVVDLFDDFLHYRTDTAPGSSGSPVFNDQWEVVALHHSGVPKYDDQGRILTTGGTPWTDGMGEHQIAWVANEGVRISRIVGHIKAQRLDGDGRRLRNDLFELAPPALGIAGGTPTRRTDAATSPAVVVGADGTATWTVP